MNETRIVLRHTGRYNPLSIDDYIGIGGFQAFELALQMGPDDVVKTIKDSQLKGRGGAGFPTGVKWELTKNEPISPKYIICNADEGEPGTNKDRILMEGDPFNIFEGMMIAGLAVGSKQGYIYLRVEYFKADEILRQALAKAREHGYLGKNILGSGFDFDIDIVLGAGAYVCGEETALLSAMEGKRGEPRIKPPYPGKCGYHGKPTVVNNVETFANISYIIENGPDEFKKIGTQSSPGTKLFTLCGNLKNRGVYEFEMGITLHDLIYDVGGGIPNGRKLKAIQTGGSSGTFVTPDKLDMRMDMNIQSHYNAIMGSGSILAIDDSHSIVGIAMNIMDFFRHESCGKCTPCREGTERLHQLMSKFMKYEASERDFETILDLASTMQASSFCGLGQTMSTAIWTTIDSFRDEYLRHTYEVITAARTRGDANA